MPLQVAIVAVTFHADESELIVVVYHYYYLVLTTALSLRFDTDMNSKGHGRVNKILEQGKELKV